MVNLDQIVYKLSSKLISLYVVKSYITIILLVIYIALLYYYIIKFVQQMKPINAFRHIKNIADLPIKNLRDIFLNLNRITHISKICFLENL
jgi:flagellar biogenesis protein FliO